MLDNMYAECLNCGWQGDVMDGAEHDSPGHLVVYKEYEINDTEAPDVPCNCL